MQAGARKLEFFTLKPVEGELLVDRLERGPLSPDELFRYAIDIGRSLQRAHSHQAVHAGLSPFAVVLTPSGARVLEPRHSPAPLAAAYRSPEQVRGALPDARADIFAYGVLLYEMASGARAFAGDHEELDREILEDPPAPLHASQMICQAFGPVIAACVEKDPDARRQRLQNAVLELRLRRHSIPLQRAAAGLHPVSGAKQVDRKVPSGAERIWLRPKFWVAAAASAGLLSVLAIASVLYLHHGGGAASSRYSIPLPEKARFAGSPSVSPDGHLVLFPAEGPDGQRMLWVRTLGGEQSVPLPGTEGASEPFWSPSGASVAFFAGGALKRTRVDGGSPQTICAVAGTGGGGTWASDDTILFAPSLNAGLFQVSARGGKPELLLPLDSGKAQTAFLWPQILPGDRNFLFFALTDDPKTTGIYAGSGGSGTYRFLFPAEANAVYSPAASSDPSRGFLLFIRDGNLIAQHFETTGLSLEGEPILVAANVGAVQSLALAPVSASHNGTLAYEALGKPARQLVWVDRSGIRLAASRESGEWGPPRISPDGQRAVAAKLDPYQQTADLWIVDAAGAVTQATNTPAHKGSPVWTPDGSRLTSFAFGRKEGNYDLYTFRAEGRSEPELLLQHPRPKFPTDWSRDGRYLLFTLIGEKTRSDVWAYSTVLRQAGPIADSPAAEEYGVLSPDSKWIAYQSDESGTPGVYVQAFDGLGGAGGVRWKVAGGAGLPHWRKDGTELFFVTAAGHTMSVAVHAEERDFAFDPPRLLFQVRSAPGTWNFYDVSPDGQKFLLNIPLEWSNSSPITVLTNWPQGLLD